MSNLNKPPTLPELIRSGVNAAVTELHTCMPAIIDSFDSATQTAKVLPAIKRIKLSSGLDIDVSPVMDVPVIFPSGGGFSLTFPVEPGDEVLLMFSERDIFNWQQLGAIKKPASKRMHDYTDAVAIIGLRCLPRALSNYSSSAVELRSDDGDNSVSISATELTLKVGALGGATFNEDGSVDFANGASITALGGFENGPSAVPGAAVTLGGHVHVAPGTPPTPGT